jgi:hypothetical protein
MLIAFIYFTISLLAICFPIYLDYPIIFKYILECLDVNRSIYLNNNLYSKKTLFGPFTLYFDSYFYIVINEKLEYLAYRNNVRENYILLRRVFEAKQAMQHSVFGPVYTVSSELKNKNLIEFLDSWKNEPAPDNLRLRPFRIFTEGFNPFANLDFLKKSNSRIAVLLGCKNL